MGKLADVWQWFVKLFDDDKPPPDIGAHLAFTEEVEAAGITIPDGAEYEFHQIMLGVARTWDRKTLKKDTLNLLRYIGENHLFTVGKPGIGKGARQIIPTLLDYPSSLVVIDPKGQNAAVTAHQRGKLSRGVFILNPYNVLPDHLNGQGGNVHNLAGYNPLDRIRPDSPNFVANTRSLAQALIVYQGGETHWADSARELVAALIMHVCLTGEGGKRNLGEVRALLSQPVEPPDAQGNLRGFLGTIEAMTKSPCLPLAQKAGQFKEGTNEIKSIISTARTQLAFLDDPNICACLSQSDFRFTDLKAASVTVFLVLPFNQLEAQGRWLRLLITSAIEELTDRETRPDDVRVLFMLDEFAQLGRLPAIERALALVRGYGVQLWPFVQDLPQLKSIYPDRWESFLATAGVLQFFTPSDATTAGYISERAGRTLTMRKSSSTTQGSNNKSSSQGYSEQFEPLYTPWELYGRKKEIQTIFFEGLSPLVSSHSFPYYEEKRFQPLARPDPFHMPATPAPDTPAPVPEPAAPAPDTPIITLPLSRSRPRV
ncbi:MAG: type IV secretory system conjugative DNA transfer family protein [Azonexus sp.]